MAQDIKELKEALTYGFHVAGLVLAQVKDGAQLKDVGAVLDGLLSEASAANVCLSV